jgi:prolipoprotein diacylglyceryltransferase
MLARAWAPILSRRGSWYGLVVAIGFAVAIASVTAQFESEKPKPDGCRAP